MPQAILNPRGISFSNSSSSSWGTPAGTHRAFAAGSSPVAWPPYPASAKPSLAQENTRPIPRLFPGLSYEIFLHDLGDLHETEQKTKDVLFRLVEVFRTEEVRDRIAWHACQGECRRQRVERILETLGETPAPGRSESLQDLLRYADRHLAADLGESVLWKTARVIVEYQIAVYLQANVHALELGYEAAAETLQETLREEGGVHHELSLLAGRLV